MRRQRRGPYGCVVFRPLSRTQLVVDLTVAVVFLLVALPIQVMLSAQTLIGVVGAVLVSGGMGGALAVRRLSPGVALAVAWGAGIVQMAFDGQISVADLAVFAVIYSAAAYGSRRVMWFGFGSAVVGALVGTGYLVQRQLGLSTALSAPNAVIVVLFAALFALMLSWTAGVLARTAFAARENRLAQHRAEQAAAVETARLRIARDMHDVVAHSLTVIVAQADGARYAAAVDPGATSTTLGTIGDTARHALADVRLLLTQLRHQESDGPTPQLTDLEPLYAQLRAAGLPLIVHVDPAPVQQPPAAVQLATYRMLQEALTNALRHGDGGPVQVLQRWAVDKVELEVHNGLAADASGLPWRESRGHGVLGMRERVQLVGGTLDAGVEADRFVVRAAIPLGSQR